MSKDGYQIVIHKIINNKDIEGEVKLFLDLEDVFFASKQNIFINQGIELLEKKLKE